INAWSEISCMFSALGVTLLLNWQWLSLHLFHRPDFFTGSSTVIFAKSTLTSTVITTVVWVLVTFLTKPEPDSVLMSFYRKVRPQVTGWRPVAARAPEVAETHDLGRNLWCWVLGTVMTYGALFGVGKLLLRHYESGIIMVLVSILCAWLMSRELRRGMENVESAPEVAPAS
ncbi:MAG: hypothetical protein ACRD41_17275, partial [Candidatus Acidiferrales bacterium]